MKRRLIVLALATALTAGVLSSCTGYNSLNHHGCRALKTDNHR